MSETIGEWRQEGESLVRDRQFEDFKSAMPDILVHGWNKVRLTLTTHSAGGLTEKDAAMARTIDGLSG